MDDMALPGLPSAGDSTGIPRLWLQGSRTCVCKHTKNFSNSAPPPALFCLDKHSKGRKMCTNHAFCNLTTFKNDGFDTSFC